VLLGPPATPDAVASGAAASVDAHLAQ